MMDLGDTSYPFSLQPYRIAITDPEDESQRLVHVINVYYMWWLLHSSPHKLYIMF